MDTVAATATNMVSRDWKGDLDDDAMFDEDDDKDNDLACCC
jgi:hypothetical protein